MRARDTGLVAGPAREGVLRGSHGGVDIRGHGGVNDGERVGGAGVEGGEGFGGGGCGVDGAGVVELVGGVRELLGHGYSR